MKILGKTSDNMIVVELGKDKYKRELTVSSSGFGGFHHNYGKPFKIDQNRTITKHDRDILKHSRIARNLGSLWVKKDRPEEVLLYLHENDTGEVSFYNTEKETWEHYHPFEVRKREDLKQIIKMAKARKENETSK